MKEGPRSPLVSLGVPVYNGERFLPETLASLTGQDHSNLEIIISDNGSTDATPDICREAAKEDERIRYLRYEENRGGAWNFNNSLAHAKGEYVKFACADDVLLPTFVSSCLEPLAQAGPEYVLSFPRTRLIDEAGNTLKHLDDEHLHIDQADPHERVARYLDTRAGHILYGLMRADVYRSTRGIRPVVGPDINLTVEMACRGKFILVQEQLFLQRRHAHQVSADGADMVQWYAPGNFNRFAFPFAKSQLDCYRAALSSPAPPTERARCGAAVTTNWVLPNWRALASDVRRAVIPQA